VGLTIRPGHAAIYASQMTDPSSPGHPEPVVVAAYPDRGEAEVTKAHLAANDIEAFIIDEVEGGALPVDVEGGVCVVVHGQDAEIARRVLTRDRID
jgi:hypothetical protein